MGLLLTANQSLKDKGRFKRRYLMKLSLPEVIGWNDLAGTGKFAAEYVLLQTNKRCDLTWDWMA